jgi:hypothetical protein
MSSSARGKGGGEIPLRVEERRPQLEVFISNLPKLIQHLFYGPDKPQLLVPLSPHFRKMTKHPGGVDSIEVFKEIEV